jgi:ribonucleoside-triphosphate reductase
VDVNLSFKLTDDFVQSYADKPVEWGFVDAAGNAVGEITFLRTYSRKKPDGGKERWHEVCRRVVEGTYSLQKDWCKSNRLPWNDNKAQKSAQEMFERMFGFKWLPPGRGLWMMGTGLVNTLHNSAALQNCAFISTIDMTKHDPAEPFGFLMEASMLGVGVGFDTRGAEKEFVVQRPEKSTDDPIVISDDREGWVDSVKMVINAWLVPGKTIPVFDYSLIRPAGEPIKTFGGTAAGPDPLISLHDQLNDLFAARAGLTLSTLDITDIGNLIGVCVVSGNVRRSAELVIGDVDDENFLNAKNYKENPYRSSWGWMSNNSVRATVGQDLTPIVEGIKLNGEPGVVWMDVSRKYGRLIDGENNKDSRVAGYNPCAEQSLESGEMCTLVETFIGRHDSLEDFKRTLKFAYLYAKTVTLLPTHWQRTNAIMQRNRRIGTSISGIANFADNNSMTVLREWMDEGYKRIRYYDEIYSEWLCIRESIKMTTVKPSGTVSILAGESPGVHWSPAGELHKRGIVFSKEEPLTKLLEAAGYNVEASAYTPETTVFVQFPVKTNAKRGADDVTIFEKANLAVLAQRYWSDNAVSVTLSFNAETEAEHVGTVLHMHEGQLKTVSFLPQGNKVYEQMPYQSLTGEEYGEAEMSRFKIDFTPIYEGDLEAIDALGEEFCTTDVCEIKDLAIKEVV